MEHQEQTSKPSWFKSLATTLLEESFGGEEDAKAQDRLSQFELRIHEDILELLKRDQIPIDVVKYVVLQSSHYSNRNRHISEAFERYLVKKGCRQFVEDCNNPYT